MGVAVAHKLLTASLVYYFRPDITTLCARIPPMNGRNWFCTGPKGIWIRPGIPGCSQTNSLSQSDVTDNRIADTSTPRLVILQLPDL